MDLKLTENLWLTPFVTEVVHPYNPGNNIIQVTIPVENT